MISMDTFERHGDIESIQANARNIWCHPWFTLALRDWFVNNMYLSFKEYFHQLERKIITIHCSRITLVAINHHKKHNENNGWRLVSVYYSDTSIIKLLYLQINSPQKTLQSFSIQNMLDIE